MEGLLFRGGMKKVLSMGALHGFRCLSALAVILLVCAWGASALAQRATPARTGVTGPARLAGGPEEETWERITNWTPALGQSFVVGGTGIAAGPFTLHPGLFLSQTYSDNYLLEPDEEKRWEWLTTISPVLNVNVPFMDHAFDFTYRSDFFQHRHHDEFNVSHHLLNGTFTFNLPWNLTVLLSHEWSATTNPPTFLDDEPKHFKSNTSTIDAIYEIGGLYSIELVYTHNFDRFDESEFDTDDNDEDSVLARFNYQILSETTVFIEGGWTRFRFPNRRPISIDSDEYQILLGVSTTPQAIIVGELSGGWVRREWEDERAGDPINTFRVDANLSYEPAPSAILTLGASRSIRTTATTTTDNVSFGSSFTRTTAQLRFQYQFPWGLGASAGFGLTWRDFSGEGPQATLAEDRNDTQFFGSVGLNYPVWQYVILALNYQYLNNRSNVDAEEYIENRTMFSITLRI